MTSVLYLSLMFSDSSGNSHTGYKLFINVDVKKTFLIVEGNFDNDIRDCASRLVC